MPSIQENFLNLRNSIESRLASEIGTYQYLDGSTTPSIAVDVGGTYPPPDVNVEGLEILLRPNTAPELETTSTSLAASFPHSLVFKIWSGSYFLPDIWVKVIDLFQNPEFRPRIEPDESLGIIESQEIVFTHYYLI